MTAPNAGRKTIVVSHESDRVDDAHQDRARRIASFASSSHRSFSGWPACPVTQCHRTTWRCASASSVLPEVDVLHGLLVGGPPAVALPAREPLGHARAHVLRVGGAGRPPRDASSVAQSLDRAAKLHAVVRRLRLVARELAGRAVVVDHERRPAARSRIPEARAVRVDRHASHSCGARSGAVRRVVTIAFACERARAIWSANARRAGHARGLVHAARDVRGRLGHAGTRSSRRERDGDRRPRRRRRSRRLAGARRGHTASTRSSPHEGRPLPHALAAGRSRRSARAEVAFARTRLRGYLRPDVFVPRGDRARHVRAHGARRRAREEARHRAAAAPEFDGAVQAEMERMAQPAALSRRCRPRRYLCFYPMSKRRGEQVNWYDLPAAERAAFMRGHGEIGRKYAGQVRAGDPGLGRARRLGVGRHAVRRRSRSSSRSSSTRCASTPRARASRSSARSTLACAVRPRICGAALGAAG